MNCINEHNDVKIYMKGDKIYKIDCPNFDVDYRGINAKFSIDLTMIEGRLPVDIMLYVLDWAKEHEEELKENWRRVNRNEKLLEIKN